MKFTDKMKYILHAPASYRFSKKYSMPNVMTDSDTLNYILENRCSVCRYGDGELNLMRGVGIKFQEYDSELSKRLHEIAAAPAKENTLICLPNIFKSLDGFAKESRNWWKNYLRCTRGYWYSYFRNELYGDTNITRFYVENVDKNRDDYVRKLKLLWQNRHILIVEGQKSRLGMGNDLFEQTKEIKRILCPSRNAFAVYSEILEKTRNYVRTGNFDLIICALGPTATVLAYDLAETVQTLDLGHIDIEYEWYLRKAQTKQAIDNKSVTEVNDSCGDEVEQTYAEQILARIEA